MEIIVRDKLEELAGAAAERFAALSREAVRARGVGQAAVSGGRTPEGFFRALGERSRGGGVPWAGLHLWWADERCVPPADPRSNYGPARKLLLDRVPLEPDRVHPMPGEEEPEAGARLYAAELARVFRLREGEWPVFDLVFLGLGADGHTASLFPGSAALEERRRPVAAVRDGPPGPARLTLTLPVLNRAREVIFLAAGEEKAPAVGALFTDPGSGAPARMVKPLNGRLTLLLDRPAAALIPGELI